MKEESNTIIDIAVLCQEFAPIDMTCDNYHIVNLDKIEISEEIFKKIFYPHGETFGLNRTISTNVDLMSYVSFIYPHRTINEKPFSLLEEIYRNLEEDLCVTRNCFSTSTTIELSKQLTSIHSLFDINECSVLNSLQWSNIMNIFRETNYNYNIKNPLFVISIVFKTPTSSVKPTIVKFQYSIL